jgi:ceramide glucosyltransferase
MTQGAPALLGLLLALLGCLYLVYAAMVSARFGGKTASKPTAAPPVSILKPLKGDEPGLFRNLSSFCTQDYPAPIQLIFGVHDVNDGAISVVQRLKSLFPNQDLHLVVDPAIHGTNLKISNLINMFPAARHEFIVLADSDVGAPTDYLSRIAAASEEPGVGGVTCIYHGVAASGFWSDLAALAIDAHFLPSVLIGLHSGLAKPCLGPTIALHRSRLDEIGGLAAFSDILADDYAIGAALREKGLKVAVPPFLIRHCCGESSLAELWRHELRWARTIRTIHPVGYAGSLVTHPFVFALLAMATGMPAAGSAAAILAILCRILLLRVTTRGRRALPPYWLIPIRDLISFAVFVSSFCGREVAWRGRNYRVRADGILLHVDERTRPA